VSGQKVALARAYLRDAQVLILDNPLLRWIRAANTQSSSDLPSTAGKTALFISHRFSTVRMAIVLSLLETPELPRMAIMRKLLISVVVYQRS